MKRIHLCCYPTLALLIALIAVPSLATAASMSVTLDTRDLPRRLLHCTMEMPVAPGTFTFWYPEWVPGVHAPRGPVQNIAGLVIETEDGTVVPWTRDPLERYRFTCEVPKGVSTLQFTLDYITNQPSTNSRGVDSYGNSLLGVVNWNTVLLYPDGVNVNDLEVTPTIILPEDWKVAVALDSMETDGDTHRYEPVSFTRLMDSPVMLGEHLRSVALESGDGAPVLLHLGSEAEEALRISDDLIGKYGTMVQEAQLLFGKEHYDRYDFLVTCSGQIPYTGLEHLRSSFNAVGERDLLKEEKLKTWVGYLLPHEYVHSWCGKYRRPGGMVRENFHTAKDTRLLWVYEGLTQYLGHVLTVRSGIWDLDHYREVLASIVGDYMRQEGRHWRTLEDTAGDSYHLRGGSPSWSRLRRGQDYYNEGLLFWLEVDTTLREKSDNKITLDDFVAAFLGKSGDQPEMLGFEETEIIAELSSLVENDWEGLVTHWMKERQEALPLDFVTRMGYGLSYENEPTNYVKTREKDGNYASAFHAIGMSVSSDGVIHGSMVPGMLADKAGLAPGMKIIGVNGKKFTVDRFRDGVKESTTRRSIEFLLLDGEVFETVTLPYADGARYLHLTPNSDKTDRLADIMKGRVTK